MQALFYRLDKFFYKGQNAMKFTIKCSVFNRLAAIPTFFEPTTPEEIRQQLTCVRLENFNGKSFAIATNQKIAAVEYLGLTNEQNGIAHVIIDPVLIEQCKKEIPFDSYLEIVTIPEIAFATAKTMFGYVYKNEATKDNPCSWLDENIMDEWRTWIPDGPVKENTGPMYMNLDHVQALAQSSPSGKIVFPLFIDIKKPVVLRDREFSEWVGLFMPNPGVNEPDAKAAEVPEWWY